MTSKKIFTIWLVFKSVTNEPLPYHRRIRLLDDLIIWSI